MNNVTAALSRGGDNDPRMQALGGFSAAVLDLNPTAIIDAASLPRQDGGHRVLIPYGQHNLHVQILFTDNMVHVRIQLDCCLILQCAK